jgi:hypothetical protein
MKNFSRIYLVLICAFFVSAAHAQKLQWGLKAGWNASSAVASSNIAGIDDKSGNKNREWLSAYYGGLSFRYAISPKIRLSAEPIYNLKGANSILRIGSDESDFYTRQHYVALPILIDYKFGQHFFLEAGAEYGFMFLRTMGAPGQLENSGLDNPPVEQKDFGILFGAGYELSQRLKLNARFIYGTATVQKWGFQDPNGTLIRDAFSVRNNTIQAGLTYYFNE